MDKVYCVKCRAKTANADAGKVKIASNGRRQWVGSCKKCGTGKYQFLPNA